MGEPMGYLDKLAEARARTAHQCPATTLQKDDRWGGFVLQCELPAGSHEVHEHAMNACEPIAVLTWRGTYNGRSTEP